MNQILQSDWFRERAEFSDLDRGQRYGSSKSSRRPLAQFFSIRTSRPANNIYVCMYVCKVAAT